MLPDTILLACGRQTLKRGRRGGDLNDECLEGQQAVLKYFRRPGIVLTPTALYGAPPTSPLIPGVRAEPTRSFKLFSALQDQGQTSSREYGEAKSNCDYGSEKGLRKSNVCISRGGGGFQPPARFRFKSKTGF